MINNDLIVNCSNFNLGLALPEPYSNNDQFIRLSVYTVPMYKSSLRIQNQLSFFGGLTMSRNENLCIQRF